MDTHYITNNLGGMIMSKDFLKAVADRRSYYEISRESVISDEKIQEIIEHAVKYTPSAFNAQSARVVLLLGDKHDEFWDITLEALRKVVPADRFSPTKEKIQSFKNGHGTILFYEDISVIKDLQQQFSLYKDNFPIWSEQSSGMHQFVIWTALEMEGLGASLQHYNELIEADVKKEFNIPDRWKLIAQMPFGNPVSKPGEKEFQPFEERIKILR